MTIDTSVTKNRNGFGKIGLVLLLLAIILAITVSVYMLFFIPDPLVTGTDGFKILSTDNTVTLKGENLKSLEISIYQEGKITDLLKDSTHVKEKTYALQIKPKDLKLSNGRAIVIVKAKAGIFKKVRYEIESVIDTVPPSLEVIRAPSIVNTGSGGFALLRAKDADFVYVKLGERVFTAFKVGSEIDLETEPAPGYGVEPYSAESNSSRKVANTYYVFFPAPFDSKDGDVFYAIAEDTAGNRKINALPTRINIKGSKTSSIEIGDSFINTVVAPMLNEMNLPDPASSFKKVNEEFRQQSQDKIIEVAGNTKSEILWDGRFLQLKNSKVMATYGDERTYFYQGENISSSVHLGYDLASYANAPVGAANSGIVTLSEDLGIYGNTVIVDHGMGLMSLYSHLSTILVEPGQEVNKGQLIGKTGSTGLAGGDHLHFGILIHGYEVSTL